LGMELAQDGESSHKIKPGAVMCICSPSYSERPCADSNHILVLAPCVVGEETDYCP
jgi:hypothetical protein